MNKRATFISLLLLFGHVNAVIGLSASQQRRIGNTVARAIEMTKRRQSYDNVESASMDLSTVAASSSPSTRHKTNPRPIRTESLDVSRLNQLIKAIDKTWILPRTGSKEPVGSNFQYKKTCASIYKGRTGACQQIGFGVMCFNYCYERGEELAFKCQDISEPTYCRSNSNYESYFAKHRKDSYKLKSFVHQMISRCYFTAICNNQAILNTSILEKSAGTSPKSTKDLLSSVPAIQPGRSRLFKSKNGGRGNGEMHQMTSKQTIWDRFAVSSRQEPTSLNSNAGSIGPPTSENEGQPKYVPFWQKLLKRKNTTSTTTTRPRTTTESTKIIGDLSVEEEDPKDKGGEITADEYSENLEEEDEESEEDIFSSTVPTTSEPRTTTTKQPRRRRLRPARIGGKATTATTPHGYDLIDREGGESHPSEEQQRRHTWKPLDVKTSTTPNPCGFQGRSAAKSDAPQDSGIEGFWTKFQPGRWFQSLQYITNTG